MLHSVDGLQLILLTDLTIRLNAMNSMHSLMQAMSLGQKTANWYTQICKGPLVAAHLSLAQHCRRTLFYDPRLPAIQGSVCFACRVPQLSSLLVRKLCVCDTCYVFTYKPSRVLGTRMNNRIPAQELLFTMSIHVDGFHMGSKGFTCENNRR